MLRIARVLITTMVIAITYFAWGPGSALTAEQDEITTIFDCAPTDAAKREKIKSSRHHHATNTEEEEVTNHLPQIQGRIPADLLEVFNEEPVETEIVFPKNLQGCKIKEETHGTC